MISWEQVEMVECYEDYCNGMVIIEFDLDSNVASFLREYAHRQGMTFNALIVKTLKEFMDDYEKRLKMDEFSKEDAAAE